MNDKTVAVFGATGFLGRFVTNQLGEDECKSKHAIAVVVVCCRFAPCGVLALFCPTPD